MVRTIVHVTIRPQRARDRRRRDVLERAQRLAASLKSYLVAQDHDAKSKGEGQAVQAGALGGELQAGDSGAGKKAK
jgi:hypothetical protein